MIMELTKIPSIDFKLSKTESEIYQASQGSALKNYSAKQKTEVAIKVWSYVKMKLGLRSENSMEEQAQILSLSDDLSQFNTMTEDEVFIALRKGIRGEYQAEGTQVFFNSSNFLRWLITYQKTERMDVMRKLANAGNKESEPSPVPSDAVLKAQAIQTLNFYADSIQKAQDQEKPFNWIAGGLHVLYDIADSFSLIKLSREEKLEIFNKHMAFFKDVDKAKQASKADGYKKFVHNLVDFGCRIDDNGQTKPL
jgi:hypothetical protein